MLFSVRRRSGVAKQLANQLDYYCVISLKAEASTAQVTLAGHKLDKHEPKGALEVLPQLQ